ERQDFCRVEQVLVDGDAAFVVQIRVGHGRTVDLALENVELHRGPNASRHGGPESRVHLPDPWNLKRPASIFNRPRASSSASTGARLIGNLASPVAVA